MIGVEHEGGRRGSEGVDRSPSASGPRIGAWSKGGDLLGEVRVSPGIGGSLSGYAHCSVSRGAEGRGVRFTLHWFDGGYRILAEEWGRGKDREIWLAPAEEEEESYIGLFSEEEVREGFPYLLAALEMPDGVVLDEDGSEAS